MFWLIPLSFLVGLIGGYFLRPVINLLIEKLVSLVKGL